jgi:hypothetical protein
MYVHRIILYSMGGGLVGWLGLCAGTFSQVALRKIATAVGSVIACLSLVAFNATRSSAIATLAYCGIVFGNSFDYSGFLPNYIEVAGHDPAGTFIAWVNTLAWAGAFVSTEIINRLSMIVGGGARSWQTLWLAPVAIRIVATVLYASWCAAATERGRENERTNPLRFESDAMVFPVKTPSLRRQARDKHEENSSKKVPLPLPLPLPFSFRSFPQG